MTTDEFLRKQKAFFDLILKEDRPLKIAAQDTLAKMATRIFVEGKNSQGSLIGRGAYNDNKPLYVNPQKSPGKGFKPAGKPFEFGKTKGGKIKTVRATTRVISRRISDVGFGRAIKGKAQVEQHKTRWFPSYKDYRNTIGKRTYIVNLDLSGDLKSDFSNSSSVAKATPSKVNAHEYVVGFKRDINAKKAEGLQSKSGYGLIFNPSEKENQNFFDVATKEWDLMFKQALRA